MWEYTAEILVLPITRLPPRSRARACGRRQVENQAGVSQSGLPEIIGKLTVCVCVRTHTQNNQQNNSESRHLQEVCQSKMGRKGPLSETLGRAMDVLQALSVCRCTEYFVCTVIRYPQYGHERTLFPCQGSEPVTLS